MQSSHEAAILHDIGKIITPDSVLLKPGKLDTQEYDIIKQHVTTGEHILNDISLDKELIEIVRCHHERYDGSGYPYGLKGDEIPPLARVLAVADTFDAMTSNRIYKPKKELQASLKELESLSGIHYDSKVVTAAVKVLQNIDINVETSQLPANDLEVERLAHFYKDPLTGLYTIMYLELLLNVGLNHVFYEHLNIISMKHFTNFNSMYGWEAGNRALTQIAVLLKQKFKDSVVFRVFGDDFMILSIKKTVVDKPLLEEKMSQICEHPIYIATEYKHLKGKEQRDQFLEQLQTTK